MPVFFTVLLFSLVWNSTSLHEHGGYISLTEVFVATGVLLGAELLWSAANFIKRSTPPKPCESKWCQKVVSISSSSIDV